MTFNTKGWIVKILHWRLIEYTAIITLAFLLSLWLILHIPSLNWIGVAFIFLTVPVFAIVYYWFQKRIFKGESVDWLVTGRTLWYAFWATAVLMTLLYVVALNFSGAVPVHDNLQSAIAAQPNPWSEARCDNLRHAGEMSALVSAYLRSKYV